MLKLNVTLESKFQIHELCLGFDDDVEFTADNDVTAAGEGGTLAVTVASPLSTKENRKKIIFSPWIRKQPSIYATFKDKAFVGTFIYHFKTPDCVFPVYCIILIDLIFSF